MKHIKLFENFEGDLNHYYYSITQKEFDSLLETPYLYCFTESDIKAINDFSKPGIDNYSIEEVNFSDGSLFSSKEEYDENSYFLIADEDGLDKELKYNRVNIHCSDGTIQTINPEDFYTKYKFPGVIQMKNFSLRIEVKYSGSIFVNKVKDEWFLVYQPILQRFGHERKKVDQTMYKCDQIDGLLKFIENSI